MKKKWKELEEKIVCAIGHLTIAYWTIKVGLGTINWLSK